jgi:hypothetical protein
VKWKTKECGLKGEICRRAKERKQKRVASGRYRKTILEGVAEQGKEEET